MNKFKVGDIVEIISDHPIELPQYTSVKIGQQAEVTIAANHYGNIQISFSPVSTWYIHSSQVKLVGSGQDKNLMTVQQKRELNG